MSFTLNLLFLQLDWTEPDGGFFAGALFYLQGISFDNTPGSGGAGADWHGYKDLAHFQSGISFGQVHDQTGAAEYFAAIQQTVTAGATQAANLGNVMAALALSHKTVPVMQADGVTPQVDANNQPVLRSPFEGAQIVTLQVPITLPTAGVPSIGTSVPPVPGG